MSFGQGGPQGAPGGSQPPTPGWGPPPPNFTPDPQGPPGGPVPPGGQIPNPYGGPPPLGDAATPDWAALAATTEARGRRRKWLLVGGGVLAAGAVAGIVATAVASSGKGSDKKLPAAEKLPSAGASPEPSFSSVAPPPPPNPREFIGSAEKDKAPLTTKSLFPHSKPSLNKRTYKKVATDTTSDCASAAQGGLGSVLSDNGCRKVLRATYVRDGVAVTVGVAVFDTKEAADKAKSQSTGNIAALPDDDGPSFCKGTACRLTANAEGRYAYFTVAGYTSGKAVDSDDTKARTAGRDVSGYTFRRIMARANAQASASVKSPSPKASRTGKARPSGSAESGESNKSA
ncbi:hypothetical protein ACH4U6_19065 [Streptomyces netropsis]|uniref:hypothetical protein n=1 Tax=Streptomyces netropsis TaxID=55404 RepID=UPI0037881A50